MPNYVFAIWLPLLLLLLLILRNKKETNRQNNQLLPSPSKLPILGNMHQLSELVHQSYWNLSKKYAPVMLLQLRKIPTVVISSAEAAREVLRVHDLSCCSRPLLAGSRRLTYDGLNVAFAPYGDYWRIMKKLIVLELFSLKRVQSFQYLREKEVELLLNSVSKSASPVNLTDKLYTLAANITFKMSFGFDYRRTDLDRNRFHEVIHDAMAVAGSFSRRELFPLVGWIMDRISGHCARTERVFHELDNFFQNVINDHLKPRRKKDHDIVDVLLGIEKEQAAIGEAGHLTRDNIKGVLLVICMWSLMKFAYQDLFLAF